MEKSRFVLLLVLVISLISLANADSNGIWHKSEDIRPGIFGSDEGMASAYSFVNRVAFNQRIDISNIYDVENPSYYINPSSGSNLNTLSVRGEDTDIRYLNSNGDTINGLLDINSGSGNALQFDGGDAMITIHDGHGNFNIKSGVDENHKIVSGDGGSHIEMSDNGVITISSSSATQGNTFTDDNYIRISSSGVEVNGNEVATKNWVNNNVGVTLNNLPRGTLCGFGSGNPSYNLKCGSYSPRYGNCPPGFTHVYDGSDFWTCVKN